MEAEQREEDREAQSEECTAMNEIELANMKVLMDTLFNATK